MTTTPHPADALPLRYDDHPTFNQDGKGWSQEEMNAIRAAHREGYEVAMSTRADLLAEAHAQIRHLIDDLTTAVDDDGLTRYVPPAANSLVYSNMIGALIPLATRMAEALASQPAQEQPISKAQEGREPVAWGLIASNTGRIASVTLNRDDCSEMKPEHVVPLYAYQTHTDEGLEPIGGVNE